MENLLYRASSPEIWYRAPGKKKSRDSRKILVAKQGIMLEDLS